MTSTHGGLLNLSNVYFYLKKREYCNKVTGSEKLWT